MPHSFEHSEEWPALISLLNLGKKNPTFKPILWVGAGLSVAAGYPTTDQLIEQLRDKSLKPLPTFTPWDTTLAPDSAQSSFTHWIQHFAKTNTYGHLNKALAGIFNNQTNKPTDTLLNLVKLPFKVLFTTNYDGLLEAALDKTEQKFNLLTHEQNFGLEQDNLISLYKIHGSLNNIKDWTLDESSYLNFSDHYPFLDSKLKNTLFPHSIIYIGCSMLDPRVINWYRFCEEQNKLHRLEYSIAIIQKDDWEGLPEELKELYHRASVRPLLFDGFEELPELVKTMRIALKKPLKDAKAEIIKIDAAERKKREEDYTADILYEKLAPRIVQTIANIWLEAEKGTDYLTQLKKLQSAEARMKGKQAFESLVGDFVALSYNLDSSNKCNPNTHAALRSGSLKNTA
ncbi:MAG: hypothetical protein ACI8WB_005696, partial [Phenylobacterium sp.]